MDVFFTTISTVISGTLVYVISKWYDGYAIKPIKNYIDIKCKIKYYLLLYSCLYGNPLQLANDNSEMILKAYEEASNNIRKIGAELSSIIGTLPKTVGKKIPKKSDLAQVVKCLIGISNSFYLLYNKQDIERLKDTAKLKEEIEKILG